MSLPPVRPTLFRVAAVVLAVAITGCSGDSDGGSARSTSPAVTEATVGRAGFVAAPGVAPVAAGDITAAGDVRAMLTSLGFPSSWLVPDGVTITDVVGVSSRQSTGDDVTTHNYVFAFERPAAPLDDVAAQWYDAYANALGSEPTFAKGTKKGNGVSGRLYSGGLPDDPAGELTVTAIGVEGGSDPVVVEVELTIESQGAQTTLALSPALLALLPDISGCTPYLVQAELSLYTSPNATTPEHGYRTIYDGTCAGTATFEAAVAWAAGRDGIVTQDAEHIEVTDTLGPNGMLIHVGAATNSSIRIDTEQSLP